MNRIVLLVLLCLVSGLSHATFELQDPSAEQREQLGLDALEGTDVAFKDTNCANFVIGRLKRTDRYYATLKWIMDSNASEQDPDAMVRWIETYCLNNQQDSLGTAVAAYGERDSETETAETAASDG